MKLIIATTPMGGIGIDNRLPWKNLQGDLERFKTLTLNQTVIMGRNTWDSLPKKPLPSRTNIVVTSTIIPTIKTVDLETAKTLDGWLIGGAKLIYALFDHITEIHLSLTDIEYDADCYIDMMKIINNFTLQSSTQYTGYQYQIWIKNTKN